MVPLQIPGGPELLIIALTFALYLAIPVLVARVVYSYMDGKNSYDERINALEAEVEELRRRVD
ncbi:hypothetical protein SAMN04487950_2026 [Halogranum rubrum]|uniref:Uncharacterized protein n=1 Tax=Halogranum rubrum TaxID=553466 RepID=A0A1I4EBG1_9EURY|nr:hypothetical protein [Halogranum rubrum]SFL02613.1 hypothetical protein SAMN04487950_2026 [Halogranum rubrum]